MDLHLSVFLLFVLFTAGNCLDCYECLGLTGSCSGQTAKTCPSGFSQCMSSAAEVQAGGMTSKVKSKDCAPVCISGSINMGVVKTTTSCCNTNLCNAQDAPDFSNVPNGNKCYYCDGKSCTNIMSCSGTEDRCIKATGNSGGQSVVVKGCVSKSICDAPVPAVPDVQSFSCCEGNLCNGAQSVTQSFLFLCGSLISYFLLH